MEVLAYKPNAPEVLDRLRYLYLGRRQDRIWASFDVPSAALTEFAADHPAGECDYPEPAERLTFWKAYCAERTALEDDSIPCIYLSEFDRGIYGGIVGGEVHYSCDPKTGWISSLVDPLLEDLHEFDKREWHESQAWLDCYHHQLDAFFRASWGKFGVSHFNLIDGLDFVSELVGAPNVSKYLLESPDLVKRVVDFAFDLNVRIQETFFEWIPPFNEGTISNLAQWMPGRIISESIDVFHTLAVEHFEKWGRPNIERMFSHFDGGILHVHGNSRPLLKAISSLEGLKAIYLADGGGPAAFNVLSELKTVTGHIPLIVEAPYIAFVDKLDRRQLPGGVFYRVNGTPDVDSANRVMDRVRPYRV